MGKMRGDTLERYLRCPTRENFLALYAEYRNLVLTTAYRVTGDWAAAEDVAQDVFLGLLLSRPALPLPASPRIYLVVLAHQLASRWIRTEERRRLREMRAARNRDHEQRPPDPLLSEIWDMLNSLDKELALTLYYFHCAQLTREEVADLMACSVRTVQRRLVRGRELLKKTFGAGVLAALAGWPDRVSAAELPAGQLDKTVLKAAQSLPASPAGGGLQPASAAAKLAALLSIPSVCLVGIILLGGRNTQPETPRDRVPKVALIGPTIGHFGERLEAGRRSALRPDMRRVSAVVVSWPEEKPIEGAVLGISDASDPRSFTLSQSDGTAILSCSDENLLKLTVQREGFLPARFTVVDPFETRLLLYLLPDKPFRFKVLDAQSASPLEGALLRLRISCCPELTQGPTGETGEVALRPGEMQADVAAGRICSWPPSASVEISAPGYVPRRIPITLSARPDERIIRLARGITITGIVFDPEGRPVASARVLARVSSISDEGPILPNPGPLAAVADESGRFALTLPRRFRACTIAVWREPFAPAVLQTEVKEPDQPLSIHLGQAFSVEGKLLAADGSPLAHMVFKLVPAGVEPLVASLLKRFPGGRGLEGVTDGTGAFHLEKVPPGRYRVTLSGLAAAADSCLTVPRQVPWVGKVQVRELWGRVLDERLKPIPRARVLLTWASGLPEGLKRSSAVECLADGSFRFDPRVRFPCRLLVTSPEGLPQEITLEYPAADLALVLSSGRRPYAPLQPSLLLRLTTEQGLLESERVTLTLRSAGGETLKYHTLARSGVVQLAGLEGDAYSIGIFVPGYRPVEITDIQLPRSSPIEVRLRSERARPR